ncbi:hypothetical protein [Plasmodium yoelii yoelii]|uniref:Uncharacterized protein n=1 Tax=Plasmodium yoelii yoelii TaxID=73239 RepID=Q7RKY8_PLAYO|nr:hypothetical protein [Plasmodium yoelii yoelii]
MMKNNIFKDYRIINIILLGSAIVPNESPYNAIITVQLA